MTVRDDFLQEIVERAASVIEGCKIEVVGDRIIMTPRSSVQSWTIRRVQNAIDACGIAEERILSDVLIQFPGEPQRCPDVAIVEDGATEKYSHEDLLAAIEIVSSKYDRNDYAIKVQQYAHFGVPIYLIIDPFRGQCSLLTEPVGDSYTSCEEYKYGDTVAFRLRDGSDIEIPTHTFKRRN
ncbi:Uma2 family endonuclease [Streptomyces sp. NPDC037389]|uniref:Uma2 family endonuclease n=1 Tax=Streptomyces sp. NPDC037389 TaxID=3155369 RepID=UPI0033C7154B